MHERTPTGSSLPFSLAAGIAVFAILECLLLAQGYLAYRDHFLIVAQMRDGGVNEGLPFVWHFGMWGDFLVISGLAAYITARYLGAWRPRWVFASLAISVATAILLSFLYTLSDIPEAHIRNHHLTAAGWLHGAYMTIAVAVFIQFLFFTKGVSVPLLRTVSALLFVHVFFGTHMALGLLKLQHPLPWYPAQPLESSFGWYTLAVVGVGLIGRNIGMGPLLWFINQRFRTSEEYLKLLDKICGVINFGYFTLVIGWQWHRGASVVSILLIALLGVVYFLSRLSVWQELEIGKSLFPRRVPDPLQMKDRVKITLEVTLFMLLYVILAWVAHCILVASLLMLIIACIDFNTRRLINREIRRYFDDPEYSLAEGEPGYQALMERRAVAEWFLFKLWHLSKEAARIAGCAVAFGIANDAYFSNVSSPNIVDYIVDAFWCAVYGDVYSAENLQKLAYAVLIATLIVNELITMWWRINRDRKLGRL